MLTIHTSPHFLPEKEYIFHVLFREMLGVAFQIVLDVAEPNYRIHLPNGAELVVENHGWKPGASHLPPTPDAISGAIPHPFQVGDTVIGLYGRPHFSVETQRIECGLDLFASAFFMLTRWEEDAPRHYDKHGRFPADKSLAAQANFLHRPVVNEWADLLWQMLQRLGWQPPRPKRHFQLSVSCDVDHPRLWWSASDRLRTLAGAVFKRSDLQEVHYFIKNHLFRKKDPFDVFDEWLDLLEQQQLVAQFNFLGARPRKSDCWYPLEHPFIKNLMEKIARRGHRIGFHPSYESFENQDRFVHELASLRAISPLEITSGRQHYLRFAAPGTWRVWQAAGLIFDSTVGYPEAEGFRCGICHDYPVFDVTQRKMLALREKPLLAMDVTLAQYRHYSPEQAATRLEQLRREVTKHGGEFTLLWHNSSWNTPFWEPWKKVFLDFVAGQQQR
jgi:hypothetical protein